MVEQFVDDGTGNVPNDYKLYIFAGVVEMIEVDVERFIHLKRLLYNSNWEKLPRLFDQDMDGDVPPPPHLGEMLAAAQTLSSGWDSSGPIFYDTLPIVCTWGTHHDTRMCHDTLSAKSV